MIGQTSPMSWLQFLGRNTEPSTLSDDIAVKDWRQAAEGAASRALLRSEIWRASLVALTALALLSAVLLLLATVSDSSPNLQARATRGCIVLAILAAYEGIVLVILSRWKRQKRASSWGFRYLNTAIEVSIPAAIVLLLGQQIGVVQALMGAAPFLTFVLIVFSALYLDFWICLMAGLIAAVEFCLLSYFGVRSLEAVDGWEMLTSSTAYWIKSAILLLTGLAAGFVASQIKRQMHAATQSVAERDRAVNMFGQHVSPQVAELLLQQPVEFSGEERMVCVMFLDIRDFSVIAGERAASEVVQYLNTLFGDLIKVVNQHQGIVNKFLGDGFMAVFGAPVNDTGPALHAVQAAQEILRVVEDLNASGKIPPTRLGIGLHLGEAVTGNVGSSERKEYTIIGDVVNLASRIEQATKQFSARLLVSEAVLKQLDVAKYPAEDLGDVELKGQSKPARLYRLA